MELLILSTCAAIFVALFTALRIPLNRWTVPAASITGIVMVFGLIQLLNYYHPHAPTSGQPVAAVSNPVTDDFGTSAAPASSGPGMIAWFHRNSLLRLGDGSAAEVTFDHIPGRVFTARVENVMAVSELSPESLASSGIDPADGRVPVLISISDPAFDAYSKKLPQGSYAQAAVYGDDFRELALVRKTLLRMSAWMNYLTPLS